MRKLVLIALVLILAACHRDRKKPSPLVHADVQDPRCDLANLVDEAEGHEVLLPYVGTSTKDLKPHTRPFLCPNKGLCGPRTALESNCQLGDVESITITAMRPDGLVGTVRWPEGEVGGCPDGLNVWIPRDQFTYDDAFVIAAVFFRSSCIR